MQRDDGRGGGAGSADGAGGCSGGVQALRPSSRAQHSGGIAAGGPCAPLQQGATLAREVGCTALAPGMWDGGGGGRQAGPVCPGARPGGARGAVADGQGPPSAGQAVMTGTGQCGHGPVSGSVCGPLSCGGTRLRARRAGWPGLYGRPRAEGCCVRLGAVGQGPVCEGHRENVHLEGSTQRRCARVGHSRLLRSVAVEPTCSALAGPGPRGPPGAESVVTSGAVPQGAVLKLLHEASTVVTGTSVSLSDRL